MMGSCENSVKEQAVLGNAGKMRPRRVQGSRPFADAGGGALTTAVSDDLKVAEPEASTIKTTLLPKPFIVDAPVPKVRDI